MKANSKIPLFTPWTSQKGSGLAFNIAKAIKGDERGILAEDKKMSLETIKKLRESTSLGINDCKKALVEAAGDFDKALKILKEKGIAIVAKKSERKTSQGIIESYIHFGGKIGAIVEINCETDFVARTELFKKFAKDVAMQIAATAPEHVRREDIPQEALVNIENANAVIKEKCLLEQAFIKNNSLTIGDYLRDIISQLGENIVIRRFSYFVLGG